MSVHFGGIITIVGAIAGLALASALGLGESAAWGFALAGGVGVSVVSTKAFGSLAWGFGAERGPGPGRPGPKWIHEEKGTGIYEQDENWLCVHYESGLKVEGESPQEVDDEMTEELREHGWYDE